jgi:hypothetical protein
MHAGAAAGSRIDQRHQEARPLVLGGSVEEIAGVDDW